MPDTAPITLLLRDLRNGEQKALDQLIPLVYAELHRIASGYLRGEEAGHILQPTALVHEAYLRLIGQRQPEYQNRSHFFGVAAHVMRQILTDHARKSRAIKRGGMAASVPLDDALAIANDQPAVVLALDDALKALQQTDERKAKLLEMRFFGGLTAEESAEAMQLPVKVVRRELRVAQAWLQRELHRTEAGVGEA